MSKWTPGPWTIDGPPDNQIVWSGPEERVCFLAHSNGHNEERDVATGHLIAAAPDLAEALEALMRQALQSPDLRATEWGQEALELARAALRRAKGET